ncbi:MAG: cell wall biogenesis protein [Deltaproteobacteria bacterium RIFCSPLOWO2_12_FULL_40_28]|nr:MAG: cell wall biogenesis protein [Deltaproteobacteria bacterium RIFCSPHIGHO2_02_FULL_40_28]OGQ19626.1 MAG: cell wall biogenesis protein [Deltaproteobacteria bacterium RIFCSPHIGHO2_12_FULL_40_32]OGQ40903.1 MAG: cell wall biogenesis protein [Deltaproteobacteria bacterium RIFCSPLOWO2_02_FULL_40_36]OGQ54018.1 MAG: cell wall biogenesis protein [Deltaproteobacteria bacterium RIFCSPLOWO2_12_FULL_40_28]
MKKNIPFFKYSAVYAENKKAYTKVLEDVLERGAFILQRDLSEFEKNLAEYLGQKYAFGIANATDGLMMALRLAGLKAGDEVILPSHTFVATAAAVHFVGGVPVLVECGGDHLIDVDEAKKSVTSKTKVIMPVQLNGRTCNMDQVNAFAKNYGLKIVEDSAQGLGSKFKGRLAGTFGVAGTFSFYPAKILNCFGDGGAIVVDQDGYAEALHQMRDHGRNTKGDIVSWGLNSRLDNLQAAILNIKLKSFDEAISYRRKLADVYEKTLGDLKQVKLPPAPDADTNHFDTYQNYEIEAQKRNELQAFLKEEGIGTLIQWGGKPLHQLNSLGLNATLPYTDELFKKCLMLPMNTLITEEDVAYVCQKIRTFYKA